MASVPSILRELARPLVALAVVLTVFATVIPAVAKSDGTWCIGTAGGLAPGSSTTPVCDHCIPAAAPPPPGLAGSVAQTGMAEATGGAATAVVAGHRAPNGIRDPPIPSS